MFYKRTLLGIALFVCPALPQSIETGQKIFSRNCAACHGEDAGGAEMGPSLSGTRRMRSRSQTQIRNVIRLGIPTSGMPAFPKLPNDQLDALAAFLHSLNATASEAQVAGSPATGEQFFFGKGGCAACHMIHGRGTAIGPDLSDVAKQLTLGEIRQTLKNPDTHITPGYQLVSVKLRSGRTMRGFARSRTNYDLQLQTLDGQFQFFQASEIASIEDEKHGLMKPLSATPEETRDVVAFLTKLTGVTPGPVPPPLKQAAGAISFDRIVNPKPGDWLTYNGTLNGNRFSNLKQIDPANVSKLGIKWIFPIEHFGLEVTPLVADGVMYLTGPNQAIAIDASTGRQLWKYERARTPGLIGDASLGTNRGLAVLGDKVYMTMDNAHVIALNRTTGALVWDVYMPDAPMKYGSTVAPLPVKDTIIAGVSGGDRGIRGFLDCYKASTGERLWRLWTIPKKGDPGIETWQGPEPVAGGGATWLTGAYDPSTDTLYWPTGNPWPDSDDKDRPGDNLYTNCILAINPNTGKIKWHYQFTPHDVHDWDATEPPLLVDTTYNGEKRKLLLHGDRNGFFYVLDRTNGKVLLAKPFAKRNTWTAGIGPDGRPMPSNDTSPFDCPSDAANWNSATYSESTRLFYVLTLEQCRLRRLGPWKAGQPQTVEPPQKILRAISIDTGKIAWEVPFEGTVIAKSWPGLLGTATGLLFYSDPNGTFAAADQKTGKTLWHFPTNVLMKASPMTFMVGGKQYVATVAGPNIVCFGL